MNDELRIGVYICECNGEIDERIDLDSLIQYVQSLPNVKIVKKHKNLTTKEGLKFLKEDIQKEEINRVVVAGGSAVIYEDIISNAIIEAGLNKYIYEQVNIREHCAWVHKDKGMATEKAKVLISMAVAKARLLQDLKGEEVEITDSALVIGGGVAGMQTALDIANRGFKTYLVERNENLGGRAYKLSVTFPTSHCSICCIHDCKNCMLVPKTFDVLSNENIEVLTSSEVKTIEGYIGNYNVKIEDREGNIKEIMVGTIIIATGSEVIDPNEFPEYGYEDEDILTMLDWEEHLKSLQGQEKTLTKPSNGEIPKSIHFIQCVGSRTEREGRKHCSIVCCNYAIGQAIDIKERFPEIDIYIHYMDIRGPYTGIEEYYKQAQNLGIKFIRGRVASVQKVGNKIVLKSEDTTLGEPIEMEPDLVILAAGQKPAEGTEGLSKMLYQDIHVDGFFQHVNAQYRSKEETGIFIAGCAIGPKGIRYSVEDAKIAAVNAIEILEKGKMELSPVKSNVIDENCDGCAYCVDPCPYNAITLIEYMKNGDVKKIVHTNKAQCRGCGTCVATCPKKGIEVLYFTPDQLNAMVGSVLGVW